MFVFICIYIYLCRVTESFLHTLTVLLIVVYYLPILISSVAAVVHFLRLRRCLFRHFNKTRTHTNALARGKSFVIVKCKYFVIVKCVKCRKEIRNYKTTNFACYRNLTRISRCCFDPRCAQIHFYLTINKSNHPATSSCTTTEMASSPTPNSLWSQSVRSAKSNSPSEIY